MTEAELAAGLQTRFLRTTRRRQDLQSQVITGGLYDIEKIFGIYQQTETPHDRFGVVPVEAAAEEVCQIGAKREVHIDLPTKVDHYIFKQQDFDIPAFRAYRMKNVYLSFDVTRFGLPEYYFFDQDRKIINGLFFGGSPFLEEPYQEIEDPCVMADDFFARFNICHLLFDKLPRAFGALQRWGTSKAVFFTNSGYTRDLCAMLNIEAVMPDPRRRRGTIFMKDCVCYSESFNQLRHPSRLGDPLHMEALQTLRTRVNALDLGVGDTPKRYLITRPPGAPRAFVNHDAVLDIFRRHGFADGDPATMTPHEQMAFFANVSVLAGAHGAGLANLAFMPKGGTVIEFLPPLCATGAYWGTSAFLGLSYRHLTCEDPELGVIDSMAVAHTAANNRRDIIVPEAALNDLLASLDA